MRPESTPWLDKPEVMTRDRHSREDHGAVDPSVAASGRGIRAVKWSFAGLFVSALLQVAAHSHDDLPVHSR